MTIEAAQANLQMKNLLPILEGTTDEVLQCALVELFRTRPELLRGVLAALSSAGCADVSLEDDSSIVEPATPAAGSRAEESIDAMPAEDNPASGCFSQDGPSMVWPATPSAFSAAEPTDSVPLVDSIVVAKSISTSDMSTSKSTASFDNSGTASSENMGTEMPNNSELEKSDFEGPDLEGEPRESPRQSPAESDSAAAEAEEVPKIADARFWVKDWKPVKRENVLYPAWFNHDAIQKVKRRWPSRQGDVVIASSWPTRGIQRMFAAMVEGRDPWEPGLLDKQHFLEGAVSSRGADEFLEILASWPGRRLFKTYCLPSEVPFQWPPTEEDIRNGTAPKVVVLISDPRYAMSLVWEVAGICNVRLPLEPQQPVLSDWIEAIVDKSKQFELFVDPFKHAMAWACEAMKWPDYVQLIQAERFASLDPREVQAACAEFADFIGISNPTVCASGLVTAVANRPHYAAHSLARDVLIDPQAIRGGPLVELLGPRVQDFESGLAPLSHTAKSEYRRLLFRMMESPFLVDVARRAAGGVCSVPPLSQFAPLKGEAAHAAGTCRMCVFALRGTCKNAPEMCPYCHLPGHSVPKRPSRAKRMQRRAAVNARCRTPSVDGLSS